MNIVIDTWQLVVIISTLILLLMGIYSINNRRSVPTNTNGVSLLIGKLDAKDSRISDLVDAIRNKDEIINGQKEIIQSLQNRITIIEAMMNDDDLTQSVITSPTVLLIGGNIVFTKTDEIALNKARIDYHRISNATIQDIEDEFRRRRLSGNMYKYVIFTAHMSAEGIHLEKNDEILDAYWLNTNLIGVELVILNGCQSVRLADAIMGVVTYVISMSENVPNATAGSFLYAFWKNIKSGDSVMDAYNKARTIEPEISSYSDIQTGE